MTTKNMNKSVNIMEDIPWQYRAGFIAREAEYCKKESDLYYSLPYGTDESKAACDAVVSKRAEFYQLWMGDKYL